MAERENPRIPTRRNGPVELCPVSRPHQSCEPLLSHCHPAKQHVLADTFISRVVRVQLKSNVNKS